MKKILIVDDHVMIRHGLIQVLHSILDTPVAFDEASDGQQAITMVKSCLYDLVLLDISLPDQSGLDVLKLLQQHDPKLRVIILSTHPEEHFVVRASWTITAGSFCAKRHARSNGGLDEKRKKTGQKR